MTLKDFYSFDGRIVGPKEGPFEDQNYNFTLGVFPFVTERCTIHQSIQLVSVNVKSIVKQVINKSN